MIKGRAEVSATEQRARRFSDLHFLRLGKTDLWVSPAGFGTYRTQLGDTTHEQALGMCLDAGINLIDTSANYGDGLSEQLIGKVLGEKIAAGNLKREEVVLVSKVGYLQGENYALSQDLKAAGKPFPDLVPFEVQLEHCIHPDFIEDQLERSLARLDCEFLDVYLLHNPEYFLKWAHNQGQDRDGAEKEYYARISKAFGFLEKAVKRGKIGNYGISSNTFPVAADQVGFTSLEKVWRIAEELGSNHHFRVIQFPMNLLEHEAATEPNQSEERTLLRFCREKEMGTLINRPLNAIFRGRLFRLAEAETYVPEDFAQIDQLREQTGAVHGFIGEVDAVWGDADTLSKVAFRALRSTTGIHCVLIGMRRPDYVEEVLAEMKQPIAIEERESSWQRLKSIG